MGVIGKKVVKQWNFYSKDFSLDPYQTYKTVEDQFSHTIVEYEIKPVDIKKRTRQSKTRVIISTIVWYKLRNVFKWRKGKTPGGLSRQFNSS